MEEGRELWYDSVRDVRFADGVWKCASCFVEKRTEFCEVTGFEKEEGYG